MNNFKWFVLNTKPRHEFKVNKELSNNGITVYCPYKSEKRNWSDRKKTIKIPLLTSMVLVKLKPSDRSKVFISSSIKSFLFFNNSPAIVLDYEIDVLKNIEKKNFLKIKKKEYKVGESINIPNFNNYAKIQRISKNSIWVSFKELDFLFKINLN